MKFNALFMSLDGGLMDELLLIPIGFFVNIVAIKISGFKN